MRHTLVGEQHRHRQAHQAATDDEDWDVTLLHATQAYTMVGTSSRTHRGCQLHARQSPGQGRLARIGKATKPDSLPRYRIRAWLGLVRPPPVPLISLPTHLA